MYKTKQLWSPLSAVFRRLLPTTCRLAPFSANSQIPSLSSHLQSSSRAPLRLEIFPDSKISLPSFSSQSAANFDSTTTVLELRCRRSWLGAVLVLKREYAAEQSGRFIDADRTLSKPLSRAVYILRLEGVDVDEEQTVADPELLTVIMEVWEAVEEAPNSQALNQIQSRV
ncbi:putative Pentatricopeptide repeat (PPR) superfamily protein [Hibiscus syriacus]|uniref:Pentatricopeptide repeat (PPR) superfamily protein n=1 Tax=Hibiscus syriacus TaxID=106335 RepID=A0A6A3CGT4_HIBSY|nr:putative Pentatricopeptide repeat (PPR) superfamily protein [Hibiscus syriacus]